MSIGTQIPPLPACGDDYAADEKHKRITAAMDRAIELLHREGWTLQKLYSEPNAVLPLPPGRYPPGRVYLFAEEVAVVATQTTGSIVTSLPAAVALGTLEQLTPEILAEDPWASERWASIVRSGGADAADPNPRWWKQSWFDRDGAVWTIRRTKASEKITVHRDGKLVAEVDDDDDAESKGLHPVTCELVAHVLGVEA